MRDSLLAWRGSFSRDALLAKREPEPCSSNCGLGSEVLGFLVEGLVFQFSDTALTGR